MVQPKITPEDDKKLSELAALAEFEKNRSHVVRVAIRELYERRFGGEEK